METDASLHHPLRSLIFRLTPADALAYASLKQELTVWGKALWIILIAAGGVIAGILPERMSPFWWWIVVFCIAILVAVLGAALTKAAARRTAGRMHVPSSDIVLEVWGDHLLERADGENRSVALDQIAQVIPTSERLFIRIAPQPIIIPASAFEDAGDMASFADWLDEASAQAQP